VFWPILIIFSAFLVITEGSKWPSTCPSVWWFVRCTWKIWWATPRAHSSWIFRRIWWSSWSISIISSGGFCSWSLWSISRTTSGRIVRRSWWRKSSWVRGFLNLWPGRRVNSYIVTRWRRVGISCRNDRSRTWGRVDPSSGWFVNHFFQIVEQSVTTCWIPMGLIWSGEIFILIPI